jgi:MFS family permease
MSSARQDGDRYTYRHVITAYLVTSGLFTLAASLIWAVNTLFLLGAGLNIFQAMVVNATFTAAQLVFEVPTGVVADTLGRKKSLLIGIAIIIVSTGLYVATPRLGWGMAGFIVGSTLLGLGFCFQTGAGDAWLVDALDATGWAGPKDRVFAWGGMTFSAAMLVGTLAGGFLGQVNLALPYVLRAVSLLLSFVATALMMREVGFEPRPLMTSRFGAETRKIFDAGVRYGVRNAAFRPLLVASLLGGVFQFYGFYAWQSYMLKLLGLNLVWLVGVVQAISSLGGILGNALVPWIRGDSRRAEGPRTDPAPTILVWASVASSALIAGIGAVGAASAKPGWGPMLVASFLWVLWGVAFGIQTPVYRAYSNSLIPSGQRATILSLDALCADGGAAVGQPMLGAVAQRVGYPASWFAGALFVLLTAPLYAASGRARGAIGGADSPSDPAREG